MKCLNTRATRVISHSDYGTVSSRVMTSLLFLFGNNAWHKEMWLDIKWTKGRFDTVNLDCQFSWIWNTLKLKPLGTPWGTLFGVGIPTINDGSQDLKKGDVIFDFTLNWKFIYPFPMSLLDYCRTRFLGFIIRTNNQQLSGNISDFRSCVRQLKQPALWTELLPDSLFIQCKAIMVGLPST